MLAAPCIAVYGGVVNLRFAFFERVDFSDRRKIVCVFSRILQVSILIQCRKIPDNCRRYFIGFTGNISKNYRIHFGSRVVGT